jgi:hypothetical protein
VSLLDLEAPFVRSVFAIADGRGEHAEAIEILRAAERRHGVRIFFDDKMGSLADVWVPKDKKPTLRQFRELAATYGTDEWQRRLETLYRVGADEDTPNAPLYGFLTETCFLLGGTDFANRHWIEYPGGVLGSWTQRAWGAQLKDWADTTGFRADRKQEWSGEFGYATFTYHLIHLVDRYDEWCRTALEVIRRKCDLQLDEL